MTITATLDERMKAAGMIPLSQLLEQNPAGRFSVHTGVTDLASFEQWLQKRHKEMLTRQIEMTLDGQEKDELFEWIFSHAAAFSEVTANFRAALAGEKEKRVQL